MFLIEFWLFRRMIDNIIFQKSVKLWSSNKIPVLLVGEIDWTPSKIFFDYRKRKILLFSYFWTQILLIFQKSQGLNRPGPHLLNRTFCLCAFFRVILSIKFVRLIIEMIHWEFLFEDTIQERRQHCPYAQLNDQSIKY